MLAEYPQVEGPIGEDVEGLEGDPANDVEEHPTAILQRYAESKNIAEELDKSVLTLIGQECIRGYEIDDESRADWKKQTKEAMELALQITKDKSWPWAKAANVKYPLITTAAVQFQARAYPAMISGEQVVKGIVIGPDPEGKKQEVADRVGHHMSYQLMEQMQGWEEDTDRLLLMLPIVGCCFRKSYFDSGLGQNVSELVAAKHLVFNHSVPYDKLRRQTQELFLYKNDVLERVRTGLFLETELGLSDQTDNEIDEIDGSYEFLEQHCWYDLDDDGYKEPYIITVRKKSGEVVRIVARYDADGIYLNEKHEVSKIIPVEYFTKYSFMPNPDGGSYDIGLGILLNPINETINTVLNQLLDSGTLANTGGGFIGKGLRMKGGPVRFAPGQYIPLDAHGAAIKDNIVPMQFASPSPVLFQLLGMLIDAGRDISSVKDILTGEQQQANVPATTTMALLEQGLKVFSAINKRIHRALKAEFKKLFRLNRLYLEPQSYYRFNDKAGEVSLRDYQADETDVVPVSDPNLVSDAQKLVKAEAMMKFIGDPFFNQMELRKRYLKAMKEEAIDTLLQEPQAPPPDPKAIDMAGRLEIAEQESIANIRKTEMETARVQAEGLLALAKAEAAEIGNQMQLYMSQFQTILDKSKGLNNGSELSGVPGLEAPPTDEAIPPAPGGPAAGPDGAMGVGAIHAQGSGGDPNAQYSGVSESGVPA